MMNLTAIVVLAAALSMGLAGFAASILWVGLIIHCVRSAIKYKNKKYFLGAGILVAASAAALWLFYPTLALYCQNIRW